MSTVTKNRRFSVDGDEAIVGSTPSTRGSHRGTSLVSTHHSAYMPRIGVQRKEKDGSSGPETRGRTAQAERWRELEEERSRQQEEQTAVSTSAAFIATTSSAPSYTSTAVPVNMPEDASRAVVAGPTSSREFGRTGGAASDVENRSRHSTAPNSPFRSGAQLPRTPARAQ